MANLLRYARETSKALVQNPKHKHAASHALVAYRTGAVFTFIPKNGCTTLRYSLALANGAIRGPEDFVWIHANNGTFSASLAELVRADVSVVILRCPFQRLASAFLDKFVSYERNAWDFRRNMDDAVDLPDLTFREFVTGLLERPVLLRSDNHWSRRSISLSTKTTRTGLACQNCLIALTGLLQKLASSWKIPAT